MADVLCDIFSGAAEVPAHQEDPARTADRAGLVYVRDEEPGFCRKRWGRGFTYLDPDGNHVQDEAVRARIQALVIPPAWTEVWICADPKGHLQATGRDDRGRKQYVYHPDWQAARNRAKFDRLIPFGQALAQIRARVERDLRLKGLPRDKVRALVVRLLDETLIRIGNVAYAEQNGTYGLSTLRDRHVDFEDDEGACVFSFKGKSGKEHHVRLEDPRLAELVRACRDVPGYHLFQYYDDDGSRCAIASDDVNAYLHETAPGAFTAKDFRTWGGTLLAATFLVDAEADAEEPASEETAADRRIREMTKHVAEHLGNTVAVCRDYYIHPDIPAAYRQGTLRPAWRRHLEKPPESRLRAEETALLAVLLERLLGGTSAT